jgi:hypothetical protein
LCIAQGTYESGLIANANREGWLKNFTGAGQIVQVHSVFVPRGF